MQSDNLAPAGRVAAWAHDLDAPPPDPLRAEGTDLEPISFGPCAACGTLVQIIAVPDGVEYRRMDERYPAPIDEPDGSRGAWLGAVMLSIAALAGLLLGLALGRLA